MSTEEEKAMIAKRNHLRSTSETVFSRIVRKEAPARIIFEDEEIMAFHDINPQAPVHFLVIPKERICMLQNAQPKDEALLGKLLLGAARGAKMLDLSKGYRVVINNGFHGCQSIYHLHVHVYGGRMLNWPPC